MWPADIDRRGKEYQGGDPREGRLARALQVDIPVWRELGSDTLADLDDHVFGVGWWAPGPGTSRRILISDHLYNCVRSVESNLIEARLHLIEAIDFWERESDFHARAVSITRDGNLEVEMPERRRPLDEITPAMGILHAIGFIRAIEMFLEAARPPVLTESAAMTLLGVLESTLRLIGEGGRLLLDVWRTRRGNPALLPQPREQWPAGPSTATAGFEGYAPGSMPYDPTQLRSDATLVRRMMGAALGDAARGAWANFDRRYRPGQSGRCRRRRIPRPC